MAQTLKAVYVQEGDAVDYTPGSDVAAGDVIDLGTFVGIAKEPITANTTGAVAIVGTFSVLKYSGEAISLGDRVYWDAGTSTATKTIGYSEAIMGVCTKAAASGDATVQVYLTPGVS